MYESLHSVRCCGPGARALIVSGLVGVVLPIVRHGWLLATAAAGLRIRLHGPSTGHLMTRIMA
jgi:hypothetical protein